MRNLSAIAYRNLWVRKGRTVATTFGVVLGVATVLAVNVMSATTTRSLNEFFAQVSGRAVLTIERSGNSTDGFRQRALRQVEAFPGVETAVAATLNTVFLESKKAGEGHLRLLLMGVDPERDPQVRSYHVIEGHFISNEGRKYALVLVARFARDHEIHLNDDVTLKIGDGEETFRVVGLLADEGAGHLNFGAVAFTPLEVAQDVLGRQGWVDQVDLVAVPEIANSAEAVERLKEDLQEGLGERYSVSTPAAMGQSINDALSSLRTGLGIFSGIAFIGGFLLIFNTFSMSVAERIHEFGLLRALGASRGQIVRMVLAEALLLAFLGSLVGVGTGVFLAIPLVRMMERGLQGLPLDRFDVPPAGIAVSVSLGVLVTLLATMLPAWRAGSITPIEALQRRIVGHEGRIVRWSWIGGVILLAFGFLQIPFHLLVGVSFFAVVFMGGTLIVPILTPSLERVSRGLITLVYGQAGRLGVMNLTRARGRTTLTVGVLMMGGVMTISTSAMTASFNNTLRHWIDSAAGGDIFVTAPQALRLEVGRHMLAVEGVEAITPMTFTNCKLVGTEGNGRFIPRDEALLFMGVDVPSYRQVSSFQFASAQDQADEMFDELNRGDAVFISTVLKDLYHLDRGDTVWLRTSRGDRDFKVAGVVVNFYLGGRSIIGSWHDMERYLGESRVDTFIVRLKPGADEMVVREGIKAQVGKGMDLEFESGQKYRETLYREVSQFFDIFKALGQVITLVAALAVMNTMTMNVLERVREIGMLRGLGMTRWQAARMILAEAAGMGVLSGAMGVGLGLAVSRVIVNSMSRMSGWHFDYVLPVSSLFITAAIVLIISQVAALYPVWRAVRLQVVEAIQHE
jgi:putative ABC transport system permease protein